MKTKPLYIEVIKYLSDLISNGYKAGDNIPTQTEISKQTNTSLITVKRAINELVAEGILETIAGKGTFVKDAPLIDNHVGISSWTDSVFGIGKTPRTFKTTINKHIPVSKIANILQLKAREHSVVITRLRGIEDKPICIMTNEIPLQLVPGLDKKKFDTGSLYAWLKENYQLVPAFANEEVYAREATKEERDVLSMTCNIVLIINRISYLANDIPFEISKIIAPANEYRYKSSQVNSSMSDISLKIKKKHEKWIQTN